MRASLVRKLERQAKEFEARRAIDPYEPPLSIKQISPISYGTAGATADFYAPMSGHTGRPMMVLLHGNPFSGTTADVKPFCMEMAKRHLPVWAVGTPDFVDATPEGSSFLTSLEQVLVFFGWLSTNASFYDAQRCPLILSGVGSGAMLATAVLQMAYNKRAAEYFCKLSPTICSILPTLPKGFLKGFASFSGWIDAPTMLRTTHKEELLAWLGEGACRRRLVDYLSLTYAPSVDYPPILLVTSACCRLRPLALSAAGIFAEWGIPYRVIDAPKKDVNEQDTVSGWHVHFPSWDSARIVNEQVAAFCRALAEE